MKRFEFEEPGPYWRVAFVYSVESYGWGGLDGKLTELLGHSDGSGTGFGERDHDWCYADEASANEAVELLRPLVNDDDAYCYCDRYEYEP